MKFFLYVFFAKKNIWTKFDCNVFEKVMIWTQKIFEQKWDLENFQKFWEKKFFDPQIIFTFLKSAFGYF